MQEAVIGILFDNQKRILLIKRRDVPVWVLPGGGIDDGESSEQAVLREVLEETGLQSKITRKIAEYTPLNRLAGYTHVYECTALSNRLSTGSETKDIGFFSLKELPKTFFFLHREWLEDALKGNNQVIKSEITQVTYPKVFLYFLMHPLLVVRFALTKLILSIKDKRG